jgi:hypothetical protein
MTTDTPLPRLNEIEAADIPQRWVPCPPLAGGNPRHPAPRPHPDGTRSRAESRDPAYGARSMGSGGAIRRSPEGEWTLPLVCACARRVSLGEGNRDGVEAKRGLVMTI